MEFTYLNLIGGLAMLVFGVLDYAFLRAVLYRPLRWRFETGKSEGRIGRNPDRVMMVIKFVNLVVLPAVGLLLGDIVLKPLVQT